MKKILFLSLAFAAFTMSVSAQQSRTATTAGATHARRGHDGRKDMMKGLNLTDAQKAQMKALHADKSLSKEARKQKMDGILTSDQKATLEKNRTAKKEAHAKKEKEMQASLGLSADQSAKLKQQNEATRAQMKALKDDKSLSADARKEKMKAIRNSAHEQRKSILTAEQQKKMYDMRKEGKKQHQKKNKQAK